MNMDRAEHLLATLARLGVKAWCVAPGGRNSPLVAALACSEGFEIHRFFEERSAAFFAVGLARALAAPVAVLTTSGTAAAEMLPAAIEATHAAVPLVLVTADRPGRFRGTGAPQTIEQTGLFGMYAPTVEVDHVEGARVLTRPIHINMAFEEPLLDRPPIARNHVVREQAPGAAVSGNCDEFAEFLRKLASPVVLVGTLEADEVAPVRAFLKRLGAPVHAEGPSRLREDPELEPLLLRGGDRSLAGMEFDGVVRFGGVPTARFWRDLDAKKTPVFSIARAPFRGLPHGNLIHGNIGKVLAAVEGREPGPAIEGVPRRMKSDRALLREVDRLLEAEPRCEPALVRRLSETLPLDARVYLGNSLPIREWDQFAATTPNRRVVLASRGANGIDGQVSTFFGLTDPAVENWALLGDLTALYDLSAPWILSQLQPRRIRIVVMNNGGGRIFSRMFENPVFQNGHDISFAPWARMWNLRYEAWDRIPDVLPVADRCVIEVRPDPGASERFWCAYDSLAPAP